MFLQLTQDTVRVEYVALLFPCLPRQSVPFLYSSISHVHFLSRLLCTIAPLSAMPLFTNLSNVTIGAQHYSIVTWIRLDADGGTERRNLCAFLSDNGAGTRLEGAGATR